MKEIINKYKLHYIAFILLIAYLLIVRVLLIFSYNLDLDGLEYYFVYFMQRVFNGTPIYTNPESFPYTDFLYTPIYIYSGSLLIWMTKLDIFNDIHQVLIVGRCFSFFIVLLQLLYFKKIIYIITKSKFHYLVLISLYLLLLNGHIYAIRPDALKVFLFSIFFYHLIQYAFFSFSLKDAIIAVLVALLAVYTKQDIVIHISVCLMVLFYFKKEKSVVFILFSFLFSSLILFVFCQLVYGKYFFANLVLFNFQQVEHVFKSYIVYLLITSLIRTVPIILLAIFIYRKLDKNSPTFLLEKYVIVTSIILFPIAHLLLLRVASNLNYTYEFIFFLILDIAIFFKYYNAIKVGKNFILMLSIAYIVVVIFINQFVINNYVYNLNKEHQYKVEYKIMMQQRTALKKIIGDKIVFFPHSKYMVLYNFKNLFLGYDMHIDRFLDLVYSTKCKSTLTFINFEEYDNNFKNGFVEYIILDNEKKSAAYIHTYYPNYTFYKKIDNLLVYKFCK